MALTENEITEIIQTGIPFMQSITSVYGSEKGQELFASITTVLGQEVNDAIWMALISGRGVRSDRFVATLQGMKKQQYVSGALTGNINYIDAIKTIRLGTHLGLKEAKDVVDNMLAGNWETFNLPAGANDVDRASFDLMRRELKAYGAKIN